jgi:hypothetical protein
MNSLLDLIIGALLFWRLAICLFGSVLISLTLAKLIPAFNSTFALVIVLLALSFGIYWQARAEAGIGVLKKSPQNIASSSQISAPVAFLGLAFIGFFLGAFLLQLNKSVVLSALALLLSSGPFLIWHRWVLGNTISWPYLRLLYLGILLGFGASVFFMRSGAGF